ncbi:MAG: efflux RND transporter permease subunit, partial [Candidatus Methylumidiphilus sp.]
MIEGLIRGGLSNRVIIVVITLGLVLFGVKALQSLSVDAFPDATNIQVQIATEAPGRSPEEVER